MGLKVLDNLELQDILNQRIVSRQELSGACTNTVELVDTGEGRYILKTGGDHHVYRIEADSLDLLRQADAVTVPEVKAVGDYLIMEYIPAGPPHFQGFAEGMHSLHALTRETPGLDFDTYLGHFLQPNAMQVPLQWGQFFWQNRVFPLYQQCYRRGVADQQLEDRLHQARDLSQDLLDFDGPYALLQGDLWSGNYFFDTDGKLVLIDPAVSYGDPDVDLAMLMLFGGGGASYLPQYLGERFHAENFRLKVKLYQGYYLLYHLLDCGRSYYQQTLDAFTLPGASF